MGRRKPKEQTALTNSEFEDVVLAGSKEDYIKSLPPRTIAGQVNIPHFQARFARQAIAAEVAAENGQETQSRVNACKLVELDAEYSGVTKEQIRDSRTPMDRVEQFCQALMSTRDALLEQDAEQMLDDLEAAFDKAREVVRVMATDAKNKQAQKTLETLEETRADVGKFLRSLLQRVRRLQEKIRNPHWTETEYESVQQDDDPDEKYVRAAAQPLQFMLYVARPPPDKTETGFFVVGDHHGKMALDLWLARNKAEVAPDRLRVPGDPREDAHWLGIPYEGIILVCPPGHTKTQFASCVVTQMYCVKPSLRVLDLHAQAGLAQSNLKLVRSYIDPATAEGRRTRTLYPELPALSKFGNNASTMTFDLPGVQRTPSAKAFGMKAKISGIDADLVWGDDIVDQETANSEADRDLTFDRWNGTISTRLRRGAKGAAGADTFHITTTTLWHHDDANCRRISLARDGKLNVLVSIQRCGGPKNGFKPLWPEVYGESYLRKKYGEMRNPRLYAACYESNPMPESMRIIGKLAFYDPNSDDHAEFLKTAEFHLSLDPAATNRKDSDHAGLVHAAVGDHSETAETKDGVETRRVRAKCRILDLRQFQATQLELVNNCGAYSQRAKVDVVHLETRSAFHGCAEMFEEKFYWQPIRHDPGNRDKGMRLRDAAAMLDASVVDENGIVACVEFPGERKPDGTIGPDPAFDWAYRQILDFGSVGDDHILDATTQLVNWLRIEGRLTIKPAGSFSRRVGEVSDAPEHRFAKYIREQIQRHKEEEWGSENVEREDWNFAAKLGGGGME